jgi:hypothetical protein
MPDRHNAAPTSDATIRSRGHGVWWARDFESTDHDLTCRNSCKMSPPVCLVRQPVSDHVVAGLRVEGAVAAGSGNNVLLAVDRVTHRR